MSSVLVGLTIECVGDAGRLRRLFDPNALLSRLGPQDGAGQADEALVLEPHDLEGKRLRVRAARAGERGEPRALGRPEALVAEPAVHLLGGR